MFVADAEIDGVSGIGDDIAEAQACDGAVAFFVLFGAIGVEDGGAVCVGPLDIGTADAIAGDGFCVPACTGAVEGMAVSDQQGDENDMVCIWGEVVEGQFAADLVAFGDGESDVDESADAVDGLLVHEEVGGFELGVERGDGKDGECRQK